MLPLLHRALLLAVLAAPATPASQATDLVRWREHLRPSDDEEGYRRIDWIPSFAEGMRAASERRRPLLLWLMNGHPLGCT